MTRKRYANGGFSWTPPVGRARFDSVELVSTPSTLPLATDTGRLDAESHRWVQRLGASGADREAAIEALHVLLLKAARFEVAHRRAILGRRYDAEHEDLAQQSADDARRKLRTSLQAHGISPSVDPDRQVDG